MSIEAKIEVTKRAIREEELLLGTLKTAIEGRVGLIASVEDRLESDKKRLEELVNEALKTRLQQNPGPGGDNPSR